MSDIEYITELTKTETLELLRQQLVIEALNKMIKDQEDLQTKIEKEIKQGYTDSLHDVRWEFFKFSKDFKYIVRTTEYR